MSPQPYVPRRSRMVDANGFVLRDWDVWFQSLAATVNALAALLQSGPHTPNTKVIGSPGDLYTSTLGGANVTLWVKESGTQTNTGWVAK